VRSTSSTSSTVGSLERIAASSGRDQEVLGVDPDVGARQCRRGLGQIGVPGQIRADAVPQHLHVQQLPGVVPFVERPRIVEALVALQPDQLATGGGGQGLGEFGLADAGRTLEQQWPVEQRGQVYHGRQLGLDQIVLLR